MNHLLLNCKKLEAGVLIILCQEVISERKTTRTVQWHLLTSALDLQLPTWGGFISRIIWLLFGKNTRVRKKTHSHSKVRSKRQACKSELVHKIFPIFDYYVLDFVLTLENKRSWYVSYKILRPLYRFKCMNTWKTT